MLPSLSLNPVLSRHDIERIHEHSLDLLERVGIGYKTPRALDILHNHRPSPPPAGAADKIEAIVAQADNVLG